MGPAEQQLFAAQLWIRALTGRTSWSGLGETRPSSRVRVPRGGVLQSSAPGRATRWCGYRGVLFAQGWEASHFLRKHALTPVSSRRFTLMLLSSSK